MEELVLTEQGQKMLMTAVKLDATKANEDVGAR
jgi:hypothetical protein